MKCTIQSKSEKLQPCNVILFPVFEDQKVESELKMLGALGLYREKITSIIELEEFKGKKMERVLVYTGDDKCPRIMLVGLGKEKEYSVKKFRECLGTAYVQAQNKKWKQVSVVLTGALRKKEGLTELASLVVRIAKISTYAYDEHKSDVDARVTHLESVELLGQFSTAEKKNLEKGIAHGDSLAEGVNFARQLGNTPPSHMNPEYLGKEALALARKNPSLKVSVLSEKEIAKLGMGCLLGVGQGSKHESKFIIIEYWGAGKKQKPSVIVGKGITFDSGGLSLKPGAYMVDMKYDMLGAAAVFGAIKAAADLKLKKNIIALVPSAENMPSGTAFRPDDILTAMNGKTVEIKNTDAEGRLVLADALVYAKKYEPLEVIDLATLTGACMAALGTERSGIFSPVDRLSDEVTRAGESVGEGLWRLPLGEEYSEAVKSEVADIKNLGGVGGDPYGGASTAAAFLQFFTDYPWAHIDLASAILMSKSKPWLRPGADGFGVETLVAYLSR